MKDRIILFAAVLILMVSSYSIVRTQPRNPSNPPPAAPPRSSFAERVAAVGLIEPASENISIAAPLPGVVDRVLVQAGTAVKQGQPLIRLDVRALEAAREQRRAELTVRKSSIATADARLRRTRAALGEARQNLAHAEALIDARSLSTEELNRRRTAVELAESDVQAATADLESAKASVLAAEAALNVVLTDLDRSTITSPIDGTVLQVRIRPGEYAAAGPGAPPWLMVGDLSRLHVRVDIDEHEAWRLRPNAAAEAQVRGNSRLRTGVRFVRFEPYVIPKQSLSGASNERVDTRVLQAVYEIEDRSIPLFVGQQMDVFIDASNPKVAPASR